MKLEQQDDLCLLTIYCHATNFYFVLNRLFFEYVSYSTAEEETIRDVFFLKINTIFSAW